MGIELFERANVHEFNPLKRRRADLMRFRWAPLLDLSLQSLEKYSDFAMLLARLIEKQFYAIGRLETFALENAIGCTWNQCVVGARSLPAHANRREKIFDPPQARAHKKYGIRGKKRS